MDEQNLTIKKKKKWLLPTIIAVIVVIAAISAIIVYILPANRLNRQLALAEKYMSELNYEAAILAYKAAIEIDPKNVEAYHGAVEAYSLADNKDGFETLYADALTVVEELSAEELDATIELVKDIYLTASNVYDDNEKTAEVLEKGYEVTNNDPEIKSSLVVTYENIIDDYQKGETPDYDKLLDMCDKLLDLDAGNTDISDTRKEILADYITDLLKDGDSDTAKELIDKNKELELDIYEKILKNNSNNGNIKKSIYDCIEKYIELLKEKKDYAGINKLKKTYPEYNDTIDYDGILNELEDVIKEVDENGYYYIPWEKTGLDDHIMNWQDQNLEKTMRKITGIEEREIMLSDVYNYTSLSLGYSDISNITALTELKNIKKLSLCGNKISDLTILNKIGKLESIDLSYNDLNDITILADLTELKTLNLSGNVIKDFSVLKNLINLTNLELEYSVEHNTDTDISFLSELTQLKYLDLSMNDIEDISPLETLTNLEYLDISRNNISDIHSLQNLTQLKTIILSDAGSSIAGIFDDTNNITDISPLANCSKLEYLSLGNSGVSDLSPLSNMQNLKELYLQLDTNINLSDISTVTSLKILDLHGAQITDISALSGLVNLEKLTLGARWYKWANKIQDISALANLKNLTYLDLSFTSVENIEILSNLTNLEYLNLYGINGEEHQIINNGWTTVGVSYEWEYIERFNNLDFLIPLVNLKQLYLGNNGLQDVTALSNLNQLENLDLSYNKLTSVDSLANLKNLKYLDLSSNQITDYSPVEFVEDLRKY